MSNKKPINLRKHQKEALKIITRSIKKGKGTTVGRVVMPTGAGKTFLEAAVLDWQQANYQTTIHLVLAPRILLANQLIEEFRHYGGKQYRAIAFHSGSHEPDYDNSDINWSEQATVSREVVAQEYAKARAQGINLVVFSTYHSCHKLTQLTFDTIIADESQYCVTENFNEAIKELKGHVKLFFTATERHTLSDTGRGLNNESVYGKRLFTIKPSELINDGLIVPPRLHVMHASTRSIDDSVVDEVVEIALEQDRLTRPELGFSKILFAMKGTKDVKTVLDNLQKLRKEFPDHDVFTITSKTGACVNGVAIRREEFLEKLRETENALIFHYDILSEGIDVDGITGVALMRRLGLAKLLQTVGRAVRIYKINPALKRQAWISVPVINGDEDDELQVREVVQAIRDGGYDISAEDVHETTTRHQSDDTTVDDAYGAYKPELSRVSIEDVFHEIEEGEFWTEVKGATSLSDKLALIRNKHSVPEEA